MQQEPHLYSLFYTFMAINFFSLVIYGLDKYKAIKGYRRTSEMRLILLALLGGWIGSMLAMAFFRHKISKKSFLWKFYLATGFNVIAMVFWITKITEIHF